MSREQDRRLSTIDVSRIGDVVGGSAPSPGRTASPPNRRRSTPSRTSSRLADADVTFDRIERLLLGLARGPGHREQRFALHAAYLQQKADGVRSIR